MPQLTYPVGKEEDMMMEDDQQAAPYADGGENRRRPRSPSPSPLRRSSRLKRRRVDYVDALEQVSHTERDHGGDYDYEVPSDDEDDSEDSGDGHDDTEVDDGEFPGGYHSQIEDINYRGPFDHHLHGDDDEIPSDYHDHVEQNTTENSAEQSEAIDFFPLEEDTELKLSILFAAVIQMAELQLLVCYDRGLATYHLEVGPIDWISVSTVAEGLTLEGLKGLYTPEACCRLFEASQDSSFGKSVLSKPNWERLRDTVCFDDKHTEWTNPSRPDDKDSGTCGRKDLPKV
ncbi:hypothetical protein FBEOM_8895 [Fusarium beomiforme]|uniref:Uncharacterized protein n=1 Tax=Fusarium beomiforme TaxID=44412 RepID=A0A9P5DTU8_9HYPO|nr:hypothetical protein FBEOM_8895 [Fusarium beomiforme]